LEVFGYTRNNAGDYPEARRIGEWILRDSLIEKIETAVRRASDKPGGTTLPELSGGVPELVGLETSLVESIVGEMKANGTLVERTGVLFQPGRERSEVSKTGKKILEAAADKEPEALEPKDLSVPAVQQEIRALVREGLLVQLEGGLYYRPEAYAALRDKILVGLSSGASFTIPEAKDRSGLTRKYIIPLLNRMEADKFVRRVDNQRIVL
ncbi:MAG: SelB C-terminal domain-containing protein, partial [bacterium]